MWPRLRILGGQLPPFPKILESSLLELFLSQLVVGHTVLVGYDVLFFLSLFSLLLN